jgi:hypothetical protein
LGELVVNPAQNGAAQRARPELRLEALLADKRPQGAQRETRAIPDKRAERLLVATWNVANLGVQERRLPK